MAIDPDTLAKQRLSVVPKGLAQVECKACGKPTSAKRGWCADCNNGRTPALWSTQKLLDVREQINAELRSRRAEIDAALKED